MAIFVEIFFSFTRPDCARARHDTDCSGPWARLGRGYFEIAQHDTTQLLNGLALHGAEYDMIGNKWVGLAQHGPFDTSASIRCYR